MAANPHKTRHAALDVRGGMGRAYLIKQESLAKINNLEREAENMFLFPNCLFNHLSYLFKISQQNSMRNLVVPSDFIFHHCSVDKMYKNKIKHVAKFEKFSLKFNNWYLKLFKVDLEK